MSDQVTKLSAPASQKWLGIAIKMLKVMKKVQKWINDPESHYNIAVDEHIAFLNMLLCKYNFYNGLMRVTMEYIQLAITLASGGKIVLAPFVLYHLYRDNIYLIIRGFGPAWGPLRILRH